MWYFPHSGKYYFTGEAILKGALLAVDSATEIYRIGAFVNERRIKLLSSDLVPIPNSPKIG